MPPRTVYIDKDKWTSEAEHETIAADIEAAKAEAPETYEV